MEYVKLGRTGLDVSRICLGCMSYGAADSGNHAWSLAEEEARPFIKRALEGGINFFDTANRYSLGSSEEILGRAIKHFARPRTLNHLGQDDHLRRLIGWCGRIPRRLRFGSGICRRPFWRDDSRAPQQSRDWIAEREIFEG